MVRTPNHLSRADAVALVGQWERLAWQMAHRFRRRTGRGDVEDYHAAGVMGLWEAAMRYDPSRGAGFGTYARRWVMLRVRELSRRLTADGFHVPQWRGFVRLAAMRYHAAGDDRPFDAPARPEPPAADPGFWRAIDRLLPDHRTRLVVWLYYRCGATDGEIAGVMGVTRARVHQLRARSLEVLRRYPALIETV